MIMEPKIEKSFLPYLKEVAKYDLLTPEEEKNYLSRCKEGDNSARERLILSYQKLVVSLAKRYVRSGIPLADLVNEGNIGLMEAIRDFNPKKRMSFSLFARFRINYRLLRALEDRGIVRIPPMKKLQIKKLLDLIPKLTVSLGRAPTREELAESLRLSPLEVEELLVLSENPFISLDQRQEAGKSSRTGRELSEVLLNPSFPSPEEILKRKEIQEEIKSALSTLQPREREVVERYFGLQDFKPQTLQKIGKAMGVSRELVRQIKKQALKKLRKRIKSEDLRFIFGFE
jgi:RNA polymerase sigma factor (sigma-70 family)|uniref:RNA polymerase sigma factor RpoD/SigA n=1 Tax=candidate division WOR-3 bacterium TaxID=2052148 RepID=A0A7C3UND6_UNCW3